MKRGQLWYVDFLIGLSLFLIVMIMAFRFISNATLIEDKDNEELRQGEKFSDALMSEGIPSRWTEATVDSFGLLTDERLDITKVMMFHNATYKDYYGVKRKHTLAPEFLLYFEDKKGRKLDIANETYIGYPGYDYDSVVAGNHEEIVQITRFMTYSHDNISEIISLKIMLWK